MKDVPILINFWTKMECVNSVHIDVVLVVNLQKNVLPVLILIIEFNKVIANAKVGSMNKNRIANVKNVVINVLPVLNKLISVNNVLILLIEIIQKIVSAKRGGIIKTHRQHVYNVIIPNVELAKMMLKLVL